MDAEDKLMAARSEGFWGLGEMGGRDEAQIGSHRAVMHGTGRVISDVVTTGCGARRAAMRAASA